MMEKTDKKTEQQAKAISNIINWLALVVFGAMLFFGCFFIVNAGERAVLLTFGNPQMTSISEGLHFKIPFVQEVVIMDVKTQKYQADAAAASSDLQDVKSTVAINYHLVEDAVPRIYKEIGIEYRDRIIQPAEQECIKAITAKFTAEELITKREEVRTQIENLLREKLLPRGIVIESVSIINFAFSESFTQAIEAKVTAEQNALTEKNNLMKVQYEAQQRIVQAEGEAKAIEIQANAIRAQGGEAYVQLQAINKWNGVLPQFMAGSGTIPFINLPSSYFTQEKA